jgi:hypothetical protein
MRVLGGQLTVDELIALAGILITVLVGGWAAVYATRADLATRLAMRREEERHDQEVRPRLEPVNVSPNPYLPSPFQMEIANRGGATPLFAFVIQSEDHIFIASGSLDEHVREPFLFQYVGQLDYKTGMFSTPFVVAQDRTGRWWDCTLNHLLAGRLIDGKLRDWLDARLRERGLTDMLHGQLTWRLLDYRIDPSTIPARLKPGRHAGLLGWLRQRLRRRPRTPA